MQKWRLGGNGSKSPVGEQIPPSIHNSAVPEVVLSFLMKMVN